MPYVVVGWFVGLEMWEAEERKKKEGEERQGMGSVDLILSLLSPKREVGDAMELMMLWPSLLWGDKRRDIESQTPFPHLSL
jgi:hypothetical protein